MEAKINFRELHNSDLIGKEIRNLFNNKLDIVSSEIKNKNWIYATLDDKQILDDDAKNLTFALKKIGEKTLYGVWAFNVFNGSDFDVDVFQADQKSIESAQHPESRLDHMDSFVFGSYPLKFLILRPDSSRKILYIMGEEDFVVSATQAQGWKIFK